MDMCVSSTRAFHLIQKSRRAPLASTHLVHALRMHGTVTIGTVLALSKFPETTSSIRELETSNRWMHQKGKSFV